MERSRIRVIGYRGRLGKALLDLGCLPLDCDITDADGVRKQIEIHRPETIINCAAKTNVDACEKLENVVTAYQVNGFGPKNVLAVFTGTFVQVSTDFVFDGVNGPYRETDAASPVNSYGFSKFVGEMNTLADSVRPLIIRTTALYDEYSVNFVTSILAKLAETGYANAPRELISTPVYTPHLAMGILYAVDKNITGILNLVNTTRISRFHWAQAVARMWGYSDACILAGPVFGAAKRPLNGGLIVERASDLGIPLFTLEQGMREMKTNWVLQQTKEVK